MKTNAANERWLVGLGLRGKVFLVVALALVSTVGGLAWTWNRLFAGAIRAEIRHSSVAESQMLLVILEELMLSGQRPEVQKRVSKLMPNTDLVWIGVLDLGGRVQVSSDPQLLDTTLGTSSPECMVCHASPANGRPRWATVDRGAGTVMRTATHIENKQACHSCHGPAGPYNGILLVDHSIAGLQSTLSAGVMRTFVVGFIGAGALFLLLAAAMEQFVFRRLRRLRHAMHEIRRNDLAVRVADGSPDELGDIAREFDDMTVRLAKEIAAEKHAQDALRESEATVVRANRLASMGAMAANVGHEINNPLAYVLVNVQSLAVDIPKLASAVARCCSALKDRVGETAFAQTVGDGAELLQPAMLQDAADRAKEALEGIVRIQTVTRSLNTFSRGEPVERSRVDLKCAIESAVERAAHEIRYRAQLVKDFGPVPKVWGSEDRLSQVFFNLFINAAHAIDKGHAEDNRIGIRTWTEGDNVCAEVSDTGCGISPEDIDRIFEPFFTTKQVGSGSGLGLSVCRNILADFGGDIRVESTVGKGSRFVVRLPVMPETPTAQAIAPG